MWLDPSVPDSAITPQDGFFFIHRMDRTAQSGKHTGGGVCIMINKRWCVDVRTISMGCSSDLEHLMIKCRPFYLPREVTAVVFTAVYITLHADTARALDDLFGVIDKHETSQPEAAFIVAGDFNKANLRKVLPKYHQHVKFPTCGANIMDRVYTPFGHAYNAHPCPAFGKSDHTSVLLPTYKQRLKRKQPMTRTIQHWTDQLDDTLRDCFRATD